MEITMAKAREQCENNVTTERIGEISNTGSVDVSDLQWVSAALEMNIRCTIADEARHPGDEDMVDFLV